MKKKRILFVYRNLVLGGAERVLIDLLTMLVNNPRYEITLMLIADQDLGYFAIPKGVIVQPILTRMEAEFSILALGKFYEGENPPYYQYWIERARTEANQRMFDHLKQTHYDLIVNFEDHFDDFLSVYQIHPTIPVIRWVHAAWYFDRWANDPKRFKSILMKQNPFVVICDAMRSLAEKTFKQLELEDREIIRIYNPINIARIQQMAAQVKEEDRALLSVPFMLQVARLVPDKNHLQLINIYAKLKQKGIKHKLYILGEGPERNKIQARINELDLTEDCLLLGVHSNPYPFMRQAELFLHTALVEGLPTVLIESMGCGTAVIAMDCPTGPREILADGKYGKVIPLGDEDSFVQAAELLLKNTNALADYQQYFAEAIARFAPEKIASEVIQFFDSLIDRHD